MDSEIQISSNHVFEGRLLNLRVDTVAMPDGTETVREIVEHEDASVIVPLDKDGNIIMVLQYRYSIRQALLELPAGLVEKLESPASCAQREFREETGYSASTLTELGGFWPSPGFCNEFIHVFLAKDLEYNPLEADDDENIKVVTFPFDKVMQMVSDGQIKDGKTIIALGMAFSELCK